MSVPCCLLAKRVAPSQSALEFCIKVWRSHTRVDRACVVCSAASLNSRDCTFATAGGGALEGNDDLRKLAASSGLLSYNNVKHLLKHRKYYLDEGGEATVPGGA